MTTTHPCRRRGRGGFTLAELLIVVVIAGIVLGFALPRFAGYLRHLTSRSTTVQLVSDLALARTQAVREGASVSLRVVGTNRYQITWDDAAGASRGVIKTVVVDGPQSTNVKLSPVGARYTFNSRGMRTSEQENLVVTRSGGQVETISITGVGRVNRERK